jgi:hypothetical protein
MKAIGGIGGRKKTIPEKPQGGGGLHQPPLGHSRVKIALMIVALTHIENV